VKVRKDTYKHCTLVLPKCVHRPMNPEKLRHIVLFTLKSTDEEICAQAIQVLNTINVDPSNGLLEWNIKKSLDTRKGVIIVENALFQNREAFDLFRASDAHIKLGQVMSQISDWIIGDYLEY